MAIRRRDSLDCRPDTLRMPAVPDSHMKITFLGTGSAMATADRRQAGILLTEGDRRLLVDCGSGILHRLEEVGVGYEGISTVLLTHHHLDHVADLLPLLKARWLAGEEHLEVVGPKGTKALIDRLIDAFDYLEGRTDLTVREVGAHEFTVASFEVEGYETRHSLPCLAYRFDDRFTFSGDSEAFEGLANFADECAILAHDCSFPDGIEVSNHPTPTLLGEALAGADADIGRVYLTHLYPHTGGEEEAMVEAVEAVYDGEVRIAEDMLTVTVN